MDTTFYSAEITRTPFAPEILTAGSFQALIGRIINSLAKRNILGHGLTSAQSGKFICELLEAANACQDTVDLCVNIPISKVVEIPDVSVTLTFTRKDV